MVDGMLLSRPRFPGRFYGVCAFVTRLRSESE